MTTHQQYRFTNRVPNLQELILVQRVAKEGDYVALVELITARLIDPAQVNEILTLSMVDLRHVLDGLAAAFEEGNKLVDLQNLFDLTPDA